VGTAVAAGTLAGVGMGAYKGTQYAAKGITKGADLASKSVVGFFDKQRSKFAEKQDENRKVDNYRQNLRIKKESDFGNIGNQTSVSRDENKTVPKDESRRESTSSIFKDGLVNKMNSTISDFAPESRRSSVYETPQESRRSSVYETPQESRRSSVVPESRKSVYYTAPSGQDSSRSSSVSSGDSFESVSDQGGYTRPGTADLDFKQNWDKYRNSTTRKNTWGF
jgi:hypothetical protein